MEGLAGRNKIVVAFNRGAVSGILNGTGTRTGPATKNKFINWLIDQ